jgi:hypothetical protein
MEIKKKIEEMWGDEDGDHIDIRYKFLLVPGCCEDSTYAMRPYLYLNFGEKDVLDVDEAVPEWRVPGINWELASDLSGGNSLEVYERVSMPVKFCPFCGKQLPKVKKKDVPPEEPVYSGDDYYCDTCDKRNSECGCLPMEALFEVEEDQ